MHLLPLTSVCASEPLSILRQFHEFNEEEQVRDTEFSPENSSFADADLGSDTDGSSSILSEASEE